MEAIGELLQRSLQFYERRDYKQAERVIDEMLAMDPHFDKALFLRGVIHYENSRHKEAQTCFQQIANVPFLWLRLALQLDGVDPERALLCYDRALSEAPKNNYALYRKGLILEGMGRHREAEDCFKNISAGREVISRVLIPTGFMIILCIGALMLISRGETGLAIVVAVSSIFCLFWLKRDAALAIGMFRRGMKGRQRYLA